MKTGMGFAGVSGQPAVLLLVVTVSLCCALAASAVAAPSAPATQGDPGAAIVEPVFTRARLVSVQKESDGRLLPRSKIPFTMLTFTAVDRALLVGIPEGAWVKFTARSVEGENLLTSIHGVEECRRFQPCD